MRFQVPQFIEIEDKIFGPLTFKQFIYIAGSVGVAVILLSLLPRWVAILLSIPVVVFGLALAFYKVNEKPFVNVVESFFKYQFGSKLYIWQKEEKPVDNKQRTINNEQEVRQVEVPKLSESKLKELTWSLDIKENQNPVTMSESTNNDN